MNECSIDYSVSGCFDLHILAGCCPGFGIQCNALSMFSLRGLDDDYNDRRPTRGVSRSDLGDATTGYTRASQVHSAVLRAGREVENEHGVGFSALLHTHQPRQLL